MISIHSIFVGRPERIKDELGTWESSIFRQAVLGPVELNPRGIVGDQVTDTVNHGRPSQAICVHPIEHYAYWKKALPGRELPIGIFGENFTTEGLLEDAVHLGDEFAVGTAEVTVTQPRLPCFKLGIRFDDGLMVKRFLASGRSGFYLSVKKAGEVGAGDEITVIARDPENISIADFNRLYVAKDYDRDDISTMERLMRITALPADWKEHFRERLATHQ